MGSRVGMITTTLSQAFDAAMTASSPGVDEPDLDAIAEGLGVMMGRTVRHICTELRRREHTSCALNTKNAAYAGEPGHRGFRWRGSLLTQQSGPRLGRFEQQCQPCSDKC